jgi:hypothetical protein
MFLILINPCFNVFNHSLLNVIINVASQKINNIFIENNIQGGIEMHHNM